MGRKEKQVERYLKGMKHAHTQAERKELERRSMERRGARRRPPRKRLTSWEEEDDESVAFEVIQRSPKASRAELAQSIAARKEAEEREQTPGSGTQGHLAGADARLVGLVLWVGQGRVRVRPEGSGDSECEVLLSDTLAETQKTSVTVGDRVRLEERQDGSLRALSVLPRRTFLSRPDPQNPRVERAVAANIDLAVIVAAVKNPELRHRLVDRYLIAVQRGGVKPLVCANKADLLASDEARRAIERILVAYRDIDVPVLFTSSETGEGLPELRQAIAGHTVVFVGQSGVGKSTLLNAVAPELELRTGRVRSGDGKGRHTTTASTLLDIGDDTRLVDTPGVRSFGLMDVTRSSLGGYFPEFVQHADACRFRDCTHAHEPHCGVRGAVEKGAVSAQRFETYQRILDSLEA